MDISPSLDATSKDVNSVSIKDKFGNTYTFDIPEETHLELDDITGDPTPIQFTYDYNSTWHLSSVTNANQTEKIIFKYHTESQFYNVSNYINNHQYTSKTYQNSVGQGGACPVENGTPTNGGANSQTVIKNRRHLKEIVYVLGTDTLERVIFTSTYDTVCPDVDVTSRRLDRIRIQRGEDGQVGILDFDLTYNTTDNNACTGNRLLLEKVQEFESSDLPRSDMSIERKEPYSFTYNSGSLPDPATTFSLDHWGYYNGAGGNSLVPNGIYPSGSTSGQVFNGGGDRSTSVTDIKTLVLNRINYPTGGYSTLKIEPHLIEPYFSWINTPMYGGGLRIEEVKNYDCNDKLLTKKTYKYRNANGSTSGKLLSQLVYDRPSVYEHFDELSLPGGGIDYTCTKTVLSAINRSQIGAVQDALVGYDRVECIVEGNDNSGETLGKTVYNFRQAEETPGKYEYVEKGLIDAVTTFNANGDKLTETFHDYSYDINDNRNVKRFDAYVVTPKTTQNNKYILCNKPDGSWLWELVTAGCSLEHAYSTKYEVSYRYALRQEWVYENQVTQRNYFYDDQNTTLGYVETITNQVYGDTAVTLPTETRVVNSDGQEFKTISTYTNSSPLVDPILQGARRHQVALPFTEEKFINNQLYYKTRIEYEDKGFRDYYPTKFYETFGNQAEVPQANVNIIDQYGNVREAQVVDGQPSAQIWSNRGSRLAASIANADVGEVAYTGFETQESSQGGWTITPTSNVRFINQARTGNGHYQPIGNDIVSATVNGGDYILSYYTNNPSAVTVSGPNVANLVTKTSTDHPDGWQYVEKKIRLSSRSAVNITVNHLIKLDELRLYPIDALMTTYAYDKDSRLPISVMDENSLPSKFNYDGLLRLTGVQNFDDDFVSVTEYLYKNSSNPNNAIKNWVALTENQATAADVKGLSNDVLKSVSYFDGIGRPQMSAAIGQSPTQKDIISFNIYDKFGRQTEQYLPYTQTSNGGLFRDTMTAKAEQKTFLAAQTDFNSNDQNFGFTKMDLEFSPLNRVFKQTAPGSVFQGHAGEIRYETNGVNEVRNFQAMGGWYAANTLYKTIQSDENGHQVIIYTDKIGRKIMQDQEGAKTYFIYDTKNQLIQVIQPETAQKGHVTPLLDNSHSTIEEGSFLYTYDEEYRMKTKVVPGCAEYQYFYNSLNQLILTIDGNDFKTFIKYDRLGRQIIRGHYTGSGLPTGTALTYEDRNTSSPHFYTTNQSFPTAGDIDIYFVSYYDDYDLNNNQNDTDDSEYEVNSNFVNTNYPFIRGLPISDKVAILKNDNSAPDTYLDSYSFYDQFRRVIHIRKTNHLNGQDKRWNKYNFPGWLEQSRREHTTTISGQLTSKVIKERWEHDHVGRELKYYHEVEGDEGEKQICEKVYNERDEVKMKKIGNVSGSNFLQTVDYRYNIRKWLEAINNPKNLGSDLFGMNINHTSIMNLGDTPNYNGNIKNITWKNSSDDIEKTYEYSYDNLNRLTAANYSQIINTTSLTESSDQYNTAYTYDGNGNIKTLTRNGLASNGTFEQIDNLDYDYDNEGRLTSLDELSKREDGFKSRTNDGTGAYTYDNNGNMLTDAHKGLSVEYNFLNLPTKVTKPEGTIEWVYDATGVKLNKTVMTSHLEVNINPIFSKEYKASMTIESKGTVPNTGDVTFTAGQSITLKEGFIATTGSDFLARIMPTNVVQIREYCEGIEYYESQLEAIYYTDGRVKYDEGSSEREYVLSDYLDNNRVLFKDLGSGTAEVIEDYTYYPFGAMHQQQSDYNQNYLFGGKELQTELELEWSDYGTRCFDNWSSKWLGVDILAEVKKGISPYAYGLGNPIRFSDPTGMIEEDENGIASVSTDLWGSSRGESFINERTNEAKNNASQTQTEQANSSNDTPGEKGSSNSYVFYHTLGKKDTRRKIAKRYGVGLKFVGSINASLVPVLNENKLKRHFKEFSGVTVEYRPFGVGKSRTENILNTTFGAFVANTFQTLLRHGLESSSNPNGSGEALAIAGNKFLPLGLNENVFDGGIAGFSSLGLQQKVDAWDTPRIHYLGKIETSSGIGYRNREFIQAPYIFAAKEYPSYVSSLKRLSKYYGITIADRYTK